MKILITKSFRVLIVTMITLVLGGILIDIPVIGLRNKYSTYYQGNHYHNEYPK